MKVTYPAMGNTGIAIKALLKGLKLEVVPPPPITRNTIALGVKYAPEFACMPLKINVGNFIEALDRGADTIVMAGGWGPCRFGYYAQVEREILRDLGYDFKMVILEAPDFKLSELFSQLRALAENVSFIEAVRAVKFAWHKLRTVEIVERKREYFLPRVKDKEEAEKLYTRCLEALDRANNKEEVDKAWPEYMAELERLERHDEEILKIGLLGEIYTVLEPASNYNIVSHLGRLNVEVTRNIYASSWVNDHLLGGMLLKSDHKHIIKCAYPYLKYWVGGHGQESVGSAVDFARKGYDGVIQIGPLTCMPEIVAQSILHEVKAREGIPCMTLYFDEHAADAGIATRLEAFVDMLKRQKQRERKMVKERII
ncbi:Predicted nucleotide-binding protein, sugar kinase/HSP70/actin superfamily [Thermosyntropha lipolytica DSM 11003]|uniref:Predicted nucleotide-binding protein, sugar kinase/HSP70/actin superfamily n=1 Tax=Thermosyntropha lipolytica DSM 11003 TaxID=1123382 RepID=A0A1M5M2R0_9FIRM|nr:CoA protein activase [Thermosyntropha lipolytica]SHG71594.1 Predicted nucleotide-binding protein, sugar kinase/HSP70/actin superfamily [Thermosyntropha lipolytica DSM 11003]